MRKQCRPWSDAAERGAWSGSALFALHPPSTWSTLNLLKVKDKYGKKLWCSNTPGKYGMTASHSTPVCICTDHTALILFKRDIVPRSGKATKRIVFHVQGRQLKSFFHLPSEKGSTLKGDFCHPPPPTPFFPFKLAFFSEEAWCAEKHNESYI